MQLSHGNLELLPNIRKIHFNKEYYGGFFEYGLQISSGDQAELWLIVRFDRDPRYGRDFMVYLESGRVASALVALWNIVTIEQFQDLYALLTGQEEIRAALATATQRADAAEAKLTAVPVDALRRHMRYSEVADHHHRYDPVQQGADEKAIDAWLAQQSEAQP